MNTFILTRFANDAPKSDFGVSLKAAESPIQANGEWQKSNYAKHLLKRGFEGQHLVFAAQALNSLLPRGPLKIGTSLGQAVFCQERALQEVRIMNKFSEIESQYTLQAAFLLRTMSLQGTSRMRQCES